MFKALLVPGVNNLGSYGRWAFAEFTGIWGMGTEQAARLEEQLEKLLEGVIFG